MKPLAADLFCGLGGWTEGLLYAGFDVIGFDNEQHVYGESRYPGQLVIQDVRTLHGSQFRDATLIVASPPCQRYSYMAMPWTRAKSLAQWHRDPKYPERIGKLNELFDACFRIKREASEVAGRDVPLIVENVCGAQPWVGRAAWHHGSYYLWGDLPALMPIVPKRGEGVKVGGLDWSKHDRPDYKSNGAAGYFRDSAIKNRGGSWFGVAHNTMSGKGRNPDGRPHGIKDDNSMRRHSSRSPKRKAASAMIAKIPFTLARHIACFYYDAWQLQNKE